MRLRAAPLAARVATRLVLLNTLLLGLRYYKVHMPVTFVLSPICSGNTCTSYSFNITAIADTVDSADYSNVGISGKVQVFDWIILSSSLMLPTLPKTYPTSIAYR